MLSTWEKKVELQRPREWDRRLPKPVHDRCSAKRSYSSSPFIAPLVMIGAMLISTYRYGRHGVGRDGNGLVVPRLSHCRTEDCHLSCRFLIGCDNLDIVPFEHTVKLGINSR